MRANQSPTSVPTLTNGMHSLSLFRANELVGPGQKRTRQDVLNATLMEAAKTGVMDALKQALNAGAEINAKDILGKTALMIAARNGHTECLNALLAKGADINATHEGGWTALMFAARWGHTECLNALLAKDGVDIHAKDILGKTALMIAARNGHTECLNALNEKGADVHAQTKGKQTALMFAAQNGYTNCLELLLANNADPNLQDNSGWTALMLAARWDHTNCLNALLKKGAAIEAKNNGWTALMVAARWGHIGCLKALIENGADANANTEYGLTALMLAHHYNKHECVQILEAAAAAAAAKENQVDPLELDEALAKVKTIYYDRQVRLKQDYALKEREMLDRWKTKPPPNLGGDLHDARLRHRVGDEPLLQRHLAGSDALAKQQLESERTAALNAVRDECQTKLASLILEEQTKLGEIETKRQELQKKYSKAYVEDHRCAVCMEIKESLGVALGCGHRLCTGCVGKVKSKCPQCRHQSHHSSQRLIRSSVRLALSLS